MFLCALTVVVIGCSAVACNQTEPTLDVARFVTHNAYVSPQDYSSIQVEKVKRTHLVRERDLLWARLELCVKMSGNNWVADHIRSGRTVSARGLPQEERDLVWEYFRVRDILNLTKEDTIELHSNRPFLSYSLQLASSAE